MKHYADNTHLPKNDQQIIMTVANEPRFDGERKPSNANTAMKDKGQTVDEQALELNAYIV